MFWASLALLCCQTRLISILLSPFNCRYQKSWQMSIFCRYLGRTELMILLTCRAAQLAVRKREGCLYQTVSGAFFFWAVRVTQSVRSEVPH